MYFFKKKFNNVENIRMLRIYVTKHYLFNSKRKHSSKFTLTEKLPFICEIFSSFIFPTFPFSSSSFQPWLNEKKPMRTWPTLKQLDANESLSGSTQQVSLFHNNYNMLHIQPYGQVFFPLLTLPWIFNSLRGFHESFA